MGAKFPYWDIPLAQFDAEMSKHPYTMDLDLAKTSHLNNGDIRADAGAEVT